MLVSFTLNWHCFIGEGKENLLIGFISEDNTLEWSRTHNANGCLKKNRSKTRRIIRLYIDFFSFLQVKRYYVSNEHIFSSVLKT